MKLIKRIFFLLVAVTLCTALSVGTFADENTVSDSENGYTDTDSDTENLYTGGEDDKGEEAGNENYENPFESAFEVIMSYSSEIFSALAFVGTLIVAHFYKKGMLPTLRTALGNISKALASVSDKTDGALVPIKEQVSGIEKTLDDTATVVEKVSASLEKVEDELHSVKESESEREIYKTIMLSQIDMLYDIFMSSALPQYKKDEIGEKIGAMRAELSGSANTGASL